MNFSGNIDAGAAKTISIEEPFTLSDNGSLITLLDEQGGIKVDRVAYSRSLKKESEWTITF